MQITLIIGAAAALATCAHAASEIPFAQAYKGDVAAASRIVLSGRVDTSVINSPSLIESGSALGSETCVALILSKSDRARAKSRNGAAVRIEGQPFLLGDLATMFPEMSGEIDGRSWSGTACAGELAVFVTRLRFID